VPDLRLSQLHLELRWVYGELGMVREVRSVVRGHYRHGAPVSIPAIDALRLLGIPVHPCPACGCCCRMCLCADCVRDMITTAPSFRGSTVRLFCRQCDRHYFLLF